MSICVSLNHVTRYRYDRWVQLSPQLVRLRPCSHARTPILNYALTVEPHRHSLSWQLDAWGNHCAELIVPDKTQAFEVSVNLVADIALHQGAQLHPVQGAENFPFEYDPAQLAELAPYRVPVSPGGERRPVAQAQRDSLHDSLHDYLASLPREPFPTAELLEHLNRRIQRDIRYVVRTEPGVQTPDQTLRLRSGSCRDSAWLLVALLRRLGLAARFVSGYLIQLREDWHTPGGPAREQADYTELHAWCEVYLPGSGWQGLDTTSGLWVGGGHIPLACAPEPSLAAPISGAVDPSEVDFSHTVRITRLPSRPSPGAVLNFPVPLRPEPAPLPHSGMALQGDPSPSGEPLLARVLLEPLLRKDESMLPGTGSLSGFDEMIQADHSVRDHYAPYQEWLQRQPVAAMAARREEAEMVFRRVGITFAVYGAKDEEGAGTERLIPFDLLPRIIPTHEWQHMQRGLVQRVTALNRFIHDVYHGQDIIKAGLVPAEEVLRNPQFRPEMVGVDVPAQTYAHIAGIDIVRAAQPDGSGTYYVLEDNLRVPSGVSYMLENRKMMMRLFPELFSLNRVAPVAHYPDLLLETLRSMSPAAADNPLVVVLTPGMYNSAYFEHAFLAQQMGVELVEGQDLFIRDGFVYMRTTQGPQRVDVIYRRIDDDFLDPLAFRADSTLGCAGLLEAYRRGNVTLCNAIGTGVADDKSIYAYVPQMIEFYLGEKPLLQNVPTWRCREAEDLAYVLAHLKDLVVKEVHGAGGYGMLVGPASTQAEIEAFALQLKANPANYIAQPTLSLSTCPTFVESGLAPRHIDLRPFVLSGKKVQMVPGGLTRVALKEGSLVVNSSQGGGTKDTWVLDV